MNRFQQCQLENMRCCKLCRPLPPPSNKAGAYLLPSVWKYVSLHFACMNAHIGAGQSREDAEIFWS